MIINGLIGGFIFIYIGAFVKWIYHHIRWFFTKDKPKSFREIYAGSGNENDHEIVMNSMSNQAVGLIFIMALVFIILFLKL